MSKTTNKFSPEVRERAVQGGPAVAAGPDLPFASWPSAAVQLHQTGHSSMAQHFRRVKVGRAGPSRR
ncbi:MAG: hypothetical protein ACI9U6_002727 [Loktanella salsilacus]|jgi:hypothetical protein